MKADAPHSSGIDIDTSAAKQLFVGEILSRNIFPFPRFKDDEAETLRMILESIDRFMEPRGEEYRVHDREGYQPDEYIQQLRELGLFGLIIPEAHGGIGLSNSAYARVIQQSSRYDASTSLTIGAHSSIGMKGILLWGNDEQKTKYLPRLATGEMIAAFCLTEAGSGSDAASIKTRATKNADGSWVLNGEKIWITNGAFAELFTVFARTDSPEGPLSAFIVERAFPGVESGPKEDKMGIRASATTTVRFDNVKVPAECLLGPEGKGFRVAMSILNNGRTGLGGGCVGGMKRMIELAARQAAERKQFGKSISEFDLVKEKLGRMAMLCYATESVVAMVGHYIDSGSEDFSVEAAMSKIFASEAMFAVANDALQIAGGNGFMREFPYERVVRDSRINLIFEGTNEILRLLIGGSGMKPVGEYLKGLESDLGKLTSDPKRSWNAFSGYAVKQLSALTAVGGPHVEHVHPAVRDCRGPVEHGVAQLCAAAIGLVKRYRKDVLERQYPLKRLADAATDLFVSLCMLSRVTASIERSSVESCRTEVQIVRGFITGMKDRVAMNLRQVERPEDALMNEVADAIVREGGYKYDLL